MENITIGEVDSIVVSRATINKTRVGVVNKQHGHIKSDVFSINYMTMRKKAISLFEEAKSHKSDMLYANKSIGKVKGAEEFYNQSKELALDSYVKYQNLLLRMKNYRNGI